MKSQHLIPLLLIVAILLVDLVVASAIRRHDVGWPSVPGVMGLGLVLAEVGLASAWLVWGGWNIALRLGVVLAVLYFLAWTASICADAELDSWFAIVLFKTGFSAALFLAIRCGKVSLDADTLAPARNRLRRQFTIWSLLSATTGLACVLAAARTVDLPGSVWEVLYVFGLAAVNSCAAFTIGFFVVRFWSVLTFVVLSSSAVSGLLSLSSAVPSDEAYLLGLLGLVQGGCVAVLVAILRVSGYRLRRVNGE